MGLNCNHGMPGVKCPVCDKEEIKIKISKEVSLKDKYSRVVEVEKDTIVQVAEYLQNRLMITLTRIENNVLFNKEMALSEKHEEISLYGHLQIIIQNCTVIIHWPP